VWKCVYYFMKWPGYQRVISLETQAGITSHRNNGGVIRYLGETIIPGELSHPPRAHFHNHSHSLSKSVYRERFKYWYEKCQTRSGSLKVCNYRLDNCNSHKTCENVTSNETVEISVTLICQSEVDPNWKTDRMLSRPLHVESVERDSLLTERLNCQEKSKFYNFISKRRMISLVHCSIA
jgi:hypothetical protein